MTADHVPLTTLTITGTPEDRSQRPIPSDYVSSDLRRCHALALRCPPHAHILGAEFIVGGTLLEGTGDSGVEVSPGEGCDQVCIL